MNSSWEYLLNMRLYLLRTATVWIKDNRNKSDKSLLIIVLRLLSLLRLLLRILAPLFSLIRAISLNHVARASNARSNVYRIRNNCELRRRLLLLITWLLSAWLVCRRLYATMRSCRWLRGSLRSSRIGLWLLRCRSTGWVVCWGRLCCWRM